MIKLLVVLFGCICLSYGLLESDRAARTFTPSVPRVHFIDVLKESDSLLSLISPSIDSEDSHLIALDLAEQVLSFKSNYVVKNSYVTKHNNVRHVYLRQVADDGREIFNADLNINVKDKAAINVGHSFYRGSTAEIKAEITSVEAMNILTAFLKIESPSNEMRLSEITDIINKMHTIGGVRGSLSPARVRAGYVQVDDGKRLEPVWDIELEMDNHWWNAHVSQKTGEVLSLFDWVNDLNSFNILPIGVNDPSEGERTVVFGPAIETASPLGWNDQGNGNTFTNTRGNNVYAQSNPTGSTGSNWVNNPRPSGGNTNDYNYPINFSQQPVSYVNASCTNLFAWNNYIHDIFYGYGFTEEAGNFQENNFGKGGKAADAVQANCQDGAGFNNANFATPPDGQRPKMRMYNWDKSTPNRDGDFDVGIIVHEYAHGISTRLTGGPANSNCLSFAESGGMGEGWGDFFATVLRQRPTYNRNTKFPMGNYASNNPNGIRKFPYTTDLKTNPETYSYINGGNYTGVHAKGEVWCGILWETYWNLVDVYGFSSNVYNGDGGNNKILRNVVDGMKLQPCNPNFVSARDAILAADKVNYNNANYCALWRGFAKRGLGVKAVGGKTGATKVTEDFSVPAECNK